MRPAACSALGARCALLLTATALVAQCAGRPSAAVAAAVVANSSQPPKVEHMIIEVSPGETAVLQCPSNDEQHRFQFWWMKPDQIIGPGTKLNSDKFKYEVLTGTLYIKVGTIDLLRLVFIIFFFFSIIKPAA